MSIPADFVEQLIRGEVEQMDLTDIARDVIKDEIRRQIPNVAKEMVSVEIKGIICAEIERFLNGPIEVNDGWGSKASWDSFELMFHQEFKKQMDQKYEVQKEIQKQVAARVKSLMDQKYQEVIQKIVDSISGTVLVPPKTPTPPAA